MSSWVIVCIYFVGKTERYKYVFVFVVWIMHTLVYIHTYLNNSGKTTVSEGHFIFKEAKNIYKRTSVLTFFGVFM